MRRVQCARREPRLKSLEPRIILFLLLYRKIHTKLCQNTRLGEYPRKTVGYVLSESNQLRKKSDVRHYILDALSLKVTAPDLLAAVGVLNVYPRK